MWRERALRIVLILFGLLFTAGLYPIVDSLRHADQKMYTDDMMLSLYVALGIFLLIASRNPLPTAAWINPLPTENINPESSQPCTVNS